VPRFTSDKARRPPKQVILSEFEEVYSEDLISLQPVGKSIRAFDGRGVGFILLPKSGRFRETGKVDTLRTLIEGLGYLSQKKIAQMMGSYHETVKHVLRDDLNIRKVSFKWVPHALNNSQRALLAQVSGELHDFLESRTNRSL
jgi:hypothetical protein